MAKASGPFFDKPDHCHRLIGKLSYLILTRPELAYVVHILAQFMQASRSVLQDAALRVVRYLKSYPIQVKYFASSEFTSSGDSLL